MTIKEAKKELAEAQWIGEDGNMACISSTPKGALRKFKRRTHEDVGLFEADELTIENVGLGWLHLASELTEAEKEKNSELAECEWYVSYSKDDTSPYQVYVYSG